MGYPHQHSHHGREQREPQVRSCETAPVRIEIGVQNAFDPGQVQPAVFGVRMISLNQYDQDGQDACHQETLAILPS